MVWVCAQRGMGVCKRSMSVCTEYGCVHRGVWVCTEGYGCVHRGIWVCAQRGMGVCTEVYGCVHRGVLLRGTSHTHVHTHLVNK
jgi:hypothetical protein